MKYIKLAKRVIFYHWKKNSHQRAAPAKGREIFDDLFVQICFSRYLQAPSFQSIIEGHTTGPEKV